MMEPLISLCLVGPRRAFAAGDEFEAEYQIDACEPEEIQSIEAAVLWYTEGKGDEDIGVHYFERRTPADAEEGDLRPLRRFPVQLPNSPLSYKGAIFAIKWCIRVRLFLKKGKHYVAEQAFTVGSVPGPQLDQELPEPRGER